MPDTIYSIEGTDLTAIADTIRSQTETEDTMTTDDMVDNINNMMNAVAPFVGARLDAELIEGQVRRVLVEFDDEDIPFCIEECRDPDPNFDYDPNTQFVATVGYINDGNFIDGCVGGIKMRSNGQDMFINTGDIFVDIEAKNLDDETEVLTFHSDYYGGEYMFEWAEDSENYHYEVVFPKHRDECNWRCEIYAYTENPDNWNIKETESARFSCEVRVPAEE